MRKHVRRQRDEGAAGNGHGRPQMVTRAELEALLETLARDQLVNLGRGEGKHRAWFRARVVSHDASAGRLVLTCFMDRPDDESFEPGERVVVAATRVDDELHSAPLDVEHSSGGPEATLQLRMAGTWQPEAERRHQLRVSVRIHVIRTRRWVAGAWRDLDATVVDLSSRGVGLRLDTEVRVGDRLSLVVPLAAGQPDLRATLEVRHVHADPTSADRWRAGGLFRNLAPADHERVIRHIFGELRTRHS